MKTRFSTQVVLSGTSLVHRAHLQSSLGTALQDMVPHYHPTVSVANCHLVVRMDRDNVPGWGFEQEDHTDLVRAQLARLGETDCKVSALV